MKFWLRGITFLLTILTAFGLGLAIGQSEQVTTAPAIAQDETTTSSFPLLEEAKGYVDEFYVKEQPDAQTVEYALVRAYLAQMGDPYTFFIEPAVAASESDALAGRYGGIGVTIQRNEQGDFVLYPFEDSPALRAGIMDGDILLEVNGNPLNLSSSMDEVRQVLRGEIKENSGVTVKVRNLASLASDEEREYFILFEEILAPSVIWRTLFEAPEIGYINVMRFTSRTPEEFTQAVNDLLAQDIQAVILDLRDNSGGLLQESIQIAGEFLDGGIISKEKRISGESDMDDSPGGLLIDLPLYVLVNSRTASAAEIVAGAIQAQDRGALVGQQTYGKGSIQRIFPLMDQSSIHVTTALWLTPDGIPLDSVGLTPDVPMIPDENGRDVELGEAVRQLQQQLAG